MQVSTRTPAATPQAGLPETNPQDTMARTGTEAPRSLRSMQATREIGRRQQASRGPKAAETGMHATSGDRQAITRADAARHVPSLRGRWRLSLGWSATSPIIGMPRNAEASMPRAPRTWPERFLEASSGSASEVESRQSAREKMSPRDRAENRPWRRRAAPATRPEDEDAINVTSGAARNPAGAWVRPSGMPAKVAMQRPRMPAAGTPEHLRVTVASREMLASTKAGSNMPTRPRAPFESTVTIPQSLRTNSTERTPRSVDMPTRRWAGMPESAPFLTGAIESRRRATPTASETPSNSA